MGGLVGKGMRDGERLVQPFTLKLLLFGLTRAVGSAYLQHKICTVPTELITPCPSLSKGLKSLVTISVVPPELWPMLPTEAKSRRLGSIL